MACATLKRSLDWESINQRPTKRRRCNPYGQGNGSSSAAGGPSSSTPSSPSGRLLKEPTPSPFAEATLARMSPGKY